jgi:hypothetical protein
MTPIMFYATVVPRVTREARALLPRPSVAETARSWYERTEPAWERLCVAATQYGAPEIPLLLADLIELGEIIAPREDFLARADRIMRPKMLDYATGDDFSDNFKRTARRAALNPAQVWVVFADKHWGAVRSYCLAGKVESEDVRDRIADLINYLFLLAGMVHDGTV